MELWRSPIQGDSEDLMLAVGFTCPCTPGRMRVASDCQNAIRSIYGLGRGAYGHIVMELKARATGFQEVQFVHEGRSSNGDAHGLARGSVSRDIGRHVWFQTPPEGVCMNYDIV